MRKVMTAILLGAASVMLAGCFVTKRPPPPRMSIKDSPPPSVITGSIPPAKASLKKDEDIEGMARSEQLKRCQQRHLDYHAGKLNETADQKRILDGICAELHRDDHARTPSSTPTSE